MYAAKNDKYTLLMLPDDDAPNPREDCDCFCKMICWHRRYNLGEDHDYDEPIDFLRDLYSSAVDDGGKRLVSFLKSRKAHGAYLEYNRSTHEWDLFERCWWRSNSESPWDCFYSAPESQLNDADEFFDRMLEALSITDLKTLIAEREDIAILPLFLYDHSVQSISTASFIGRAQHAEWDSGQVGYIYADRKAILDDFGAVNAETREKAENLLHSEVETYDQYLRGECYGFQLYEAGEEIDSCWGFLGDVDDWREDVKSYLPADAQPLADELEYTCESEDVYLRKCAVA